MMKYPWLLYVLLILAVGLSSPAQTPKEVTFTHYGHACFLITTSSETRIMTDPMDLDGYPIPPDVKPDILTVSHRHRDHDYVAGVSGEPVVFYGIDGPANKALQHKLVPIDTQINDVRIYDIACNHFNPKKSPILNAIFVFEFDSLRVVHLGDIGLDLTEDQVAQIGAVDILMIPVGGIYTLTLEEVDALIARLRPSMVVLPMHYKTEVATFLANTAEDFLKGKANVQRISSDTFTLDLDNPPKELEYVVLNSPGE